MRVVIIGLCLLLLAGCASGAMPQGAVAGCGSFAYTGTWTKSETDMRALWLSDPEAVDRMTVADVVELATALGCNRD